jgi:hypothetical protein
MCEFICIFEADIHNFPILIHIFIFYSKKKRCQAPEKDICLFQVPDTESVF